MEIETAIEKRPAPGDPPASGPAGPDIVWEEAESAPERPGIEVIAAAARTLPNAPGVYRMIDAKGEALYVGKARSLKKRVQSYTRTGGQTDRIARMIRATAAMDFVRTATEIEALLLEANLIKRLKPRCNVLMRDDKSFPYILIAEDHPSPAIMKHRGGRSRKGSYFGPFASAGAVNRTLNAMQKAFLLRTCSDPFFEGRTRPCLLYQIKRCAGPCTGEIAPEDYRALVEEAKAFLSGRSGRVRAELGEAMERAAERLDFEAAAVYRDRLSALSQVQAHQGINPRTVEEADVFAIAQQGGLTGIQVFFFRTGQNWGNRAYFPRADKSLDAAAVLRPFLAQFYVDKPVPRLVLASTEFEERELLAEALSSRAGRRVKVEIPKRGERRMLVDQALANAREALGRRLAESSSQARLLEAAGALFGLDAAPRRIEVFDNSHVTGANAVGAMIVAGPEGFMKSQYRKFNIRAEDMAPGDDVAMVREVVRRRFHRLLKEAGPRPAAGEPAVEETGAWPDLVLIDGGKGQLSAALDTLAELGIHDLPVVAVAKGRDRATGRETFHQAGRLAFTLPPRDPVLYFIERLRDEAHRFAVGAHRLRRAKAMQASPLDEIPGIGPNRKRALLRHFGSAREVGRAAVEDLRAVDGISESMANAIYEHFNERAR